MSCVWWIVCRSKISTICLPKFAEISLSYFEYVKVLCFDISKARNYTQGISCQYHSSLLSVFGLSATSTYDSYLPLIFGIFGLIWGHFWNVRKGRFRGHGGRRGQTTSKSKTTKTLNQNLLKLDEIQNLASATSKMTSWPQRPRKWLSEFFQKLHFLNQCIKLRKMSYSLTL